MSAAVQKRQMTRVTVERLQEECEAARLAYETADGVERPTAMERLDKAVTRLTAAVLDGKLLDD
jgi:hypothetical protein